MRHDSGYDSFMIVMIVLILVFGFFFGCMIASSDLPFWIKFMLLK